ncbi:Wzz/FepE/Etk N-terminal domain-containing protein [Arcobacter sp. CECT 8986]|uniref:Wzz/FepE/Etk N-terminal domain-containing protein n=1 Tax=Arcobacter sp. CECT 8986 TaxID=2044507 RepID=UPI0013E97FBF|nr:Wzz/FepE/Etk N-terminal domain-containing protein [Arcobacter sp. CECT 8986]
MEQRVNNMIEDDEIDLRELFKKLWKGKLFIIIFTLVVTILAGIYAFLKTPIYNGTISYEIGQVITDKNINLNNKEISIIDIDDASNLKEIISRKFSTKDEEKGIFTNALIPRGTSNIIVVDVQNSNKEKINKKLDEITKFIETRQDKRIKFYSFNNAKIKKTSVLSKDISSKAIKPNKKIIIAVAFVSGFILSIFLLFFIDFIKSFKEEK